MHFTSEILCKILETNFGYPRVSDGIFNNVLELEPLEAFRYSTITNSPYLLNEYGYSPFGKLTTFNHRNYSINPGLFNLFTESGEISLLNAPLKLVQKFPHMFEGKKRVVFIDVKKSNIESGLFSKLVDAGIGPENYLIMKVKSTGSELEHFFEFVACKVFSLLEYYCETQIPWSYHGKPDFAAYKSPIFNDLVISSLIPKGGLLLDLCLIPFLDKIKSNDIYEKYEFAVGEAKSKSKKSQISRYLDSGLCDWAFEIMPDKIKPSEKVGLLRIKNNLQTDLIFPHNLSNSLKEKKIKDHEWFQNYVKSLLLANIKEEKLVELIKTKSPNNTASSRDLIITIKSISMGEIIKLLK